MLTAVLVVAAFSTGYQFLFFLVEALVDRLYDRRRYEYRDVVRRSSRRFRSILDAYDGDANETVGELKYGKVAVHRTDIGRDHVRIDTGNASYLAEDEAVYSVETDSRGKDRVTVLP